MRSNTFTILSVNKGKYDITAHTSIWCRPYRNVRITEKLKLCQDFSLLFHITENHSWFLKCLSVLVICGNAVAGVSCLCVVSLSTPFGFTSNPLKWEVLSTILVIKAWLFLLEPICSAKFWSHAEHPSFLYIADVTPLQTSHGLTLVLMSPLPSKVVSKSP